MQIIGITGTLGAGKGTIVEYLTLRKGFIHFSVRNYLKNILDREMKDSNRDNYVELANHLRTLNGPSYIVDQLYNQAEASSGNAIIESIRTPGEVLSLKEKGPFVLFSVDADPRIRYKRIRERGSETDRISFEEFMENERREMNSDDPNHQSLGQCIAMADFRFLNNGGKDSLFHLVEEALLKIGI